MDKDIATEVLQKKRKTIGVTVVLSIAAIILCVWVIRFLFSHQLDKSQITTAVVHRGDIENTLTASGEIIPEFDEIITSPIEATIQSVLIDIGSKVQPGQSILALDKSIANTKYEKLKSQLEAKENELRRLSLDLDKSFNDIKSNNNIKQLNINSLQANVQNTARLYQAGGGTREEVEQAELDLKIAILEKERLEYEITSKLKTMQVQMNEAKIAEKIQKADVIELKRQLHLADITATRNGIITWINKNIGANILPGQSLARISNLNSYKVNGTISDNYVDQLYLGMPAAIRIGNTRIKGRISSISPAIQNGVVFFDVQLNSNNHKLFRPNLKVDVFLLIETRKNVLRIANGPAFKGAVLQDIFVVKNNTALRRTVQVGLSNFDYVELKDQVVPGDIIITSDMSEFKNTTKITLK